jgi:CBS domain-containing protein
VPGVCGLGQDQRVAALKPDGRRLTAAPHPQFHTLKEPAMSERTVFQAMAHRHVISLPPKATVHEAACLMTKVGCSSVLVVEPGANTMLGIVTERDLMTRVLAKAVDPQQTTVQAVMTANPQCVLPETKVADAVLIMIERGFRHLPVVGADGKTLGVFSVRDALPREVGTAVSLSEFHEQVNDALG